MNMSFEDWEYKIITVRIQYSLADDASRLYYTTFLSRYHLVFLLLKVFDKDFCEVYPVFECEVIDQELSELKEYLSKTDKDILDNYGVTPLYYDSPQDWNFLSIIKKVRDIKY